MSTQPIGSAVVGLGWAGRSIWLPRLLDNPAYDVTAVVDPNPEARAAALDTYGDAACARRRRRPRTASEVDLAVVAVPNHLHATVAAELLAAGVSVFLEKPVCLTLSRGRPLARPSATGGAVLLAGSAARYRADVAGAARALGVAGPPAARRPGLGARPRRPGRGRLVHPARPVRRRCAGRPRLAPARHARAAARPGRLHQQVVGVVSDDFVATAPGAPPGGTTAPAGRRGDVEDTARGFLVRDDGVSVVAAGELGVARGRSTTPRSRSRAATAPRPCGAPSASAPTVGPARAHAHPRRRGRAGRRARASRSAPNTAVSWTNSPHAGRPGSRGRVIEDAPTHHRGHRAPLRLRPAACRHGC